ncbi:MAG: c-type cytochrome [Bacteroidetes bacterium]|nr:c-type cytochrome [Bacteroidota bacterium]MBS1935262.1 c-type cytochrome [Bacteroidota bacterium]
MKKVFFIISSSLLIIACGNSGDSKSADSKDSAAAKPATVSAASEKGLELIGSSDCTTCHRLQKDGAGAAIGPSYSEVAAKYAPAADTTIDRLAQKIIKGGSGVWGAVPMTPHPALAEADVKEIVKYIMTLKK